MPSLYPDGGGRTHGSAAHDRPWLADGLALRDGWVLNAAVGATPRTFRDNGSGDALGRRAGAGLFRAAALLCAVVVLSVPAAALAEDSTEPTGDYDEMLKLMPRQVQDVRMTEKLGETAPLNLPFVDEEGRKVTLGHYVDGQHPVILTLNYYRCPRLCTLQLNGVVEVVREVSLNLGRDYKIVTVSFDPAETPALANLKKQSYIRALGRPAAAAGWHFLTGEQHHIRTLADAVGYRYKWLDSQQQYAHPSAMMVLAPDGIISRYLYGIKFKPKTVRLSLVEASDGKVGSTYDRFLLTCFHFDPAEGTYVAGALTLMRVGGALTVLILGGSIGLLLLREFHRRKAQTTARS